MLSCLNVNYKLTFKIIACILVIGIVLNCAIPNQSAHAEAITVTIAVVGCILALLAASYGLTVAYGSTDAAVKDFWALEAQDFVSRSPEWSTIGIASLGVAWLDSRLEDPSLLLDDLTISFCNDFFYDWCNTKYNIPENSSTPVQVASQIGGIPIWEGNFTPVQSSDYQTALNANPYPYYEIPFDNDIISVFVNNNTIYFQYLGQTIFTQGFNYNTAEYFNITGNASLGIYRFNFFTDINNVNWVWSRARKDNEISRALNNISAYLSGTLDSQTVPQVDYGTALTYTGAPSTTYEDFFDTGIEEILLDTYTPTLTEDIPWDEPIPVPEQTTWEDGALEFWQAVGGAISGGLSTAGQTVRSWINSMHAQMVEYWDALLEWCDGIVGAIEGAEDGFVRGIINEISSVFASAKNTIRSALGIWHYVVDWVRSITVPFNLFLGLAGRVSSYITLPVYASIAGLVILGIYKKFIG